MKTMEIRMERAINNAQQIAEFLSKHPKVVKVYYPGLESHQNYSIHRTQAKSGGQYCLLNWLQKRI